MPTASQYLVLLIPQSSDQVISSAVVAMAMGTGVAGFSTARSLGVVSAARRCYELLTQRSTGASTNGTSTVDPKLTFPDSAWPGFRIGGDENAFERGAGVAGAVTICAAVAIGFVALAALLQLKLTGWRQAAVQLPMAGIVGLVGLLLDGTVAAAALTGGLFTFVGLIVPLVLVILVVASGWRRKSHYEARYLLEFAPTHRLETFRTVRRSLFGRLFVAFVGVGAWQPPNGAAPEVEMREVSAPAALIGRQRGPGTQPTENSLCLTLCVYYLAIDAILAAGLSLTRGLLINVSCSAAAGMMCSLCWTSFVLLLILRPLPSVVKNVVAIAMAAFNGVATFIQH